MPKLLQLNVTSNWGSTGKIVEAIANNAIERGWESWVAYGRMSNPSNSRTIKVGTAIDPYVHYVLNRVFDLEGRGSVMATCKLIKQIQDIKPDIIQLHNLHDHWLNYKILFEYLNKTDIKVVWTFHDFWAVTGHCTHFVQMNCGKFKSVCAQCPFTKNFFLPILKQTKRTFELKKKLFTANKRLTIVPVSDWVNENVCHSFLKDNKIKVIPNGIDTTIFKPKYNFFHPSIAEDSFVIMAVSSQWKNKGKGLPYYYAISKLLNKNEIIVLVGLPKNEIKKLPSNIVGVERTDNQEQLASLYTRANVICSFSSAETFGLTIIEGFACGTPAVVFDNTAPPKLITPKTGIVVPDKDYKAAYQAIQEIKKKGKAYYSKSCVQLVKEKYEKEKCFSQYIQLYDELLKKN